MKAKQSTPIRWIILTGLSGSGKTSALKILEDQGFSAIDNLPIALLPSLIQVLKTSRPRVQKLVLGMDARGRGFLVSYHKVMEVLKKAGIRPEILFFDCKTPVLIRRFSESRRPHPLRQGNKTLIKAIEEEKRYLEPLKRVSTKIFDTSRRNVHQLKKALLDYLSVSEKIKPMEVHLLSFGFKFGTPDELDLLFDVRFLKNPFFEPRLKKRLGTSPSIKKYVMGQSAAQTFLKQVTKLLIFLIPHFQKEGKALLTVGFGCTGGRHRSVSMVEALREKLVNKNCEFVKIHRDMTKES